MRSKSSPPKPDLVVLVIAFALIGMAVTLAYQIGLYANVERAPIAKQAVAPKDFGG
ncbi:hypothetical protein [Thiocapsa bogorovii]|uniref:hypothetical protein n=1 Tax=Thiocapsa bogorovii TaxID=521689 RepID=UPI001E28330C|nr:hypothetical protein [Thiocapsa bogorovii]UHD14591.1 hypothetical protein LT988_14940 [Thiocapsa bogorovii]